MSTTNAYGVNTKGELINKVSVEVFLTDQSLPLLYLVKDFRAARGYLASEQFKEIADRVHFVTLTNRGV